jgi:hypothetical protein
MTQLLKPRTPIILTKNHRNLKKLITVPKVLTSSFNSLMIKKEERVFWVELLVCNAKPQRVKWQTSKVQTSSVTQTRRRIPISKRISRKRIKKSLILLGLLPLKRRNLRISRNLRLKLKMSSSLSRKLLQKSHLLIQKY